MRIYTVDEITQQIELIKEKYNTEPTESNEGDCLNASEGYELLLAFLRNQ